MAYLLSDGGSNIVTYPYTIGMLRRDNPNVSFPSSPSEAVLNEWNVYTVVSETTPTIDVYTQTLSEGQPTTTDGGVTWTQTWVVNELDAAAQASKLAQLEQEADSLAMSLIDEADQYVVTALVRGKGLSVEFETYRAALLDWTNLTGYPADPTWPVIPTNIFTDTPTALPIDAYTKSETDSLISSSGGSANVDLTDIETNSVTFNSVNVTIAGTEKTVTEDANNIFILDLGPKMKLGRPLQYYGNLINFTYDAIDEAEWGGLENAEWARGEANTLWVANTDVTAASFSTELDDFGTYPGDAGFETHITSGEYVIRWDNGTDPARYWKMDFHTWVDQDQDDLYANSTPAPYSYTRTEYSDPVNGVLDPTTEVTVTVTGEDDSHQIDVLVEGLNGLALHRGFGTLLGNPHGDDEDGALYDQGASKSFNFPYGTRWSVVNDFVEILDSTTVYSDNFMAAFGNNESSIPGSKAIMHDMINDKYWGITFHTWEKDYGIPSIWSADVVELNNTLKSGITFSDGSQLITKPGNVTSNKHEWTDTVWQNNFAPLAFFRNEDIGNNDVTYSGEEIYAAPGVYGIFKSTPWDYPTSFSNHIRLDRIYSLYESSFESIRSNSVWSSYSGSFLQAYNWGSYRISDRRNVNRVRIGNYGNYWNVNLTTEARSFLGHFTSKWYIENTNTTQNSTIVPTGITLNYKPGVTLPTVAPGETWYVEIEVYTKADNTPTFTVTDSYQIV